MSIDKMQCRECGTKLQGKAAIDVGYCLPCYNMMMAGPDEDEDDVEPEYYQCLGCQWSGVENPGPICPRCSGATVEGVY